MKKHNQRPVRQYVSPLKTKQYGMVVLSMVIILLMVAVMQVSFTMRSVLQYDKMTRAISSTLDIESSVLQTLSAIGHQLRTKNVDEIDIENSNVTYTIQSLSLAGENQQHLTQYTVAVTSTLQPITYTEQFLRYPALINVPPTGQAISHVENTSYQLFNRALSEFTPAYFPQITEQENCENLNKSRVYWVTGNCEITKEAIKSHSATTPLLVIVRNGDITLSDNVSFYGVIIHLSDTMMPYSLAITKSATLHGALVSNTQLNETILGNASYRTDIISALQQQPSVQKIIPIPGSWYASHP